MPKYICPVCGKEMDLPEGNYTCKECDRGLFKKATGPDESFLLTHYIVRLKEQVVEEGQDSDLYLALADQAEKLNKFGEAGILRVIASEEKSHQRMIQNFFLK